MSWKNVIYPPTKLVSLRKIYVDINFIKTIEPHKTHKNI
jgi:hypothetical protein